MPHSILLRLAREKDLPAVVDLCLLVERQHERYWPLRWQLRPDLRAGWLGWVGRRLHDPDMLVLAGYHEQQVVGALLATIEEEMPIYAYSRYAMLHDVAVLPAYQNRGLGQRLLRRAARWAGQRGVNQLRLMVADQNREAQRLFAAVGFRETYHEMVLPLPGSGSI